MNMLTFSGSTENDPRILEWIADHQTEQGQLAARWFSSIRNSGSDITELLHDGLLTACIGEYPFAYVGAFKSHINVGFFYGSELSDPDSILVGSGKRMRHVKLKPGTDTEVRALENLIAEAYLDIKERINQQNRRNLELD